MAIEKIIVLEDEAVIRKHLTELLQRKNFLVAQADSVSKAKQLVDKDDFDLIFAYPWPSEGQVIERLFERYAADGALLLIYHQFDAVQLYRKRSKNRHSR